jgi:peptide/nickel transport system substrate-binding protein/oligopeptide transport system substrate-binding protein
MVFYKADDTTFKAYQANEVDSSRVPSVQLANAKAMPDNQFHQIPVLDVYYFGLNAMAKPFDNLKIRQAFALALNKDEIAHNVYKDKVIATNHIVPNGMPGYNPALTGPQNTKITNGNQTLAKQLFQQGMQDEKLTAATFPTITLTVSSQGDTDQRNEFAAEQQMWKSVLGVNVKIDDVDFGKLLDERANTVGNPNGMQMYALDWSADYPDAEDWLTLLFDKGSSKNAVNFGQNNTPESAQEVAVQKLMEQADGNSDPTQRLQQYNQAEQQIVNFVAWIPRYQATSSLLRKPCVVGVVDNPQAMTPPEDWGSIYISTATPCGTTSQYQ